MKTVKCPLCKQSRNMTNSNYDKVKSHNCRKCEDKKRVDDVIAFIQQKMPKIKIIRTYKKETRTFVDVQCIECDHAYSPSLVNLKRSKNFTCKSCASVASSTSHGKRYSRIYNTWRSMKKRCSLNARADYKYYGGKGIRVCNEWNDNFEVFYEWSMRNGYKDNLVIDRIDSNKNYMPSNCQFLTPSKNSIKANTTDRLNNLINLKSS